MNNQWASKHLCSAYIFYKWNDTDTLNSVLEKCDDGEDTIHTEVSFYTDKVVLRKTDCKIFDAKKHTLQMSYKDFADMMNAKDKIDWCGLYDWEVIDRMKDIGNLCVYCHEDTSLGSGKFINRIPAETETETGYCCHNCYMEIEDE